MTHNEAMGVLINSDRIWEGITRKEKEAINMAIVALEDCAERRWIPVTERLPETKEDGCWFFVTKEENETYTGSPKTEVYMTFFDERNQQFGCSGRTTAWMPIIFPEPYKEEQK